MPGPASGSVPAKRLGPAFRSVILAAGPRGGVTVAGNAGAVTVAPALASGSTATAGAPPGWASSSRGVSAGTGTPGSSQRTVSFHRPASPAHRPAQPPAPAKVRPGVHAATRPRPYCHCASTGYRLAPTRPGLAPPDA